MTIKSFPARIWNSRNLHHTGLLFFAFLGGLGAPPAEAQYFENDPNFAPVLEGPTIGGGAGGYSYPGGKLLVTSSYSIINGYVSNGNLVRLDANGAIDSTFLSPGRVGVLAVYPDGRFLFRIQPDSGVSTILVKRALADGSTDPAFAPVSVNYDLVQAVLLSGERILLYNGNIATVSGTAQRGLALLETNGVLAANFQSPFASNSSPTLNAAVPTADGHIIIAGANLNLGSGSNYIARLNSDGTLDNSFNAAAAGFSAFLGRFYPAADGSMLVMNASGGNPLRLNVDGSRDLLFSPVLIGSSQSFGERQPDGKIFYTSIVSGSPTRRELHRMNADGTNDASFPVIATPYSSSYEIGLPVLSDDGTFFVGALTAERKEQRLELTHVLANGTTDPDYNPRFSRYALIGAYARQADGKHFVAGQLDYVSGHPMPDSFSLVRISDDGAIDLTFSVSLMEGSSISKIEPQADGGVLVFGSFPAGGSNRDGVRRFTSSGDPDPSFHPIPYLLSPTASDGFGQMYGTYNDGNGYRVRRYAANGQIDATFQSPLFSGFLDLITPLADGSVLTREVKASSSASLVRLLHDGTKDPTFAPYPSLNLVALVALPDGKALMTERISVGVGGYVFKLTRIGPNSILDFEYTTVATNNTFATEEIKEAMAGVLLQLLRAAFPTTSESVTADFRQTAARMVVNCRTDGEITILDIAGGSSGSYLHRLLPVSLNATNYPAEPTVLALSPQAALLRPLNTTLLASVSAGGLAPFSYQWLRNGVPIVGKTTAFLNLPGLQITDAGNYSVVITNSHSSTTSSTFTVTIDTAHSGPVIVTQPVNQITAPGGSVTFSIGASGNPSPSYQWRFNGSNIPGATGASLTLNNVQAANAGSYRVNLTNTVVNSGGSFGTSVTSGSVTLTISTPPAGDFNSDGKADILWRNKNTGEVGTWLMNGTAISSYVPIGSVGPELKIVGTGDFNGDGKSDILWRNRSTGEVGTWIMNGTGVSFYVTIGTRGSDWLIAGTGDFNGDSKRDILWRNRSTGEIGTWLLNGTVISSSVTIGSTGSELLLAGTGDFNGDGKVDVLWRNSTTGDVITWLMNGTAISSTITLGSVGSGLTIAGTGDYNSDGKTDILWRNSSTGEVGSWLLNGTTVSSYVTLGFAGLELVVSGSGEPLPEPSTTAVPDFNGDGKADIIWRNTTTGEVGVWLMNGTSVTGYVTIGHVGPPWTVVALGDLNADGKTDIVWRNPTTGDVGVWLMNGTTVSSYQAIGSVAAPWIVVGLGDFNADGKPDLVWRNPSTGDVGAWLMNGTTVTSYQLLGSVGGSWTVGGVGDFNSDGKPDILWRDTSTGNVGTWLMNGTSVSSYQAIGSVGSPWTIAGVADLNGDGKPDVLWRNPTNGDVGIWTLNGITVTGYVSIGSVGSPWIPFD